MSRRRLGWAAAGAGLALGSCRAAPSTLDPRSPEARRLASAWWQMFALGAAVYAVVAGLIVWTLVRRRAGHRDGGADRERLFVVAGGVAAPVAVLAVVAFITVDTTADVGAASPGPALAVEVVGHTWWWEVRYPAGGRAGEPAVVTANELRIPVGRPVQLTLSSADVLHSFWVPELAGKVDLIPGATTTLRFSAERPGTYQGACAEFCGIQHANMRFLVVAEEPGGFDRWRARQGGPAAAPTSELEARGQAAFMGAPCAGCHTVRGTPATATLGPDLSDFGTRRTLGAGLLPNTAANLARWIVDAPELKPGVLMPPIALSPAEVDAIVAYLEALG